MLAPYISCAQEKPCLHCSTLTLNAGRGLCLRCYRNPAVRPLYPARKPGRKQQPHGYCAVCQSNHRALVSTGLCWICARAEHEDQPLAAADPQRQQRIARYTERAARRLPLFSD